MKLFFTDILKIALGVFIGAGALVITVKTYDSFQYRYTPNFGSIHFDGTVSMLEQPPKDIAIISF